MQPSELDRQLAEMLEKGFNGSFLKFCAEEFSSHRYAPENLPAARMHAFYLRMALELLPCGDEDALQPPEETGSDRVLVEFYRITRECYLDSTESGTDFCESFIRRWCDSWAG